MENVSFDIPRMYADHHVLAVRELLLQTRGVEEVRTSALLKKVWVTFDPAVTSAQALQEVLQKAGYGPGEALELARLQPAAKDGSFWHTWYPRDTRTNPLDIEMSGDFRRY